MRRFSLLCAFAALTLIGGCKAEPDFDEKFEQRARELSQKARKIEADANARLAAAREADEAQAELATPARDASR